MRIWALGYAAAALPSLILDGVWLSTAAAALYRPALGRLLSQRLHPIPALAFYLIYVAGIVGLAVAPALALTKPLAPAAFGAGPGFVAYATSDLTHLATPAGRPGAAHVGRDRPGRAPVRRSGPRDGACTRARACASAMR